MKKIISILAVLSILIGCSSNEALTKRYQLEKQFHAAEKKLEQYSSFTQNQTEDNLNEIRNDYSEIIKSGYSALEDINRTNNKIEADEITYLTYQASNRLAQIDYTTGNYNECIAIYNQIIRELNIPQQHLVSVWINMGQSYQASGQWDSAYYYFNQTIDKFSPPLKNDGEIILPVFNLPMHMYNLSSLIKDSALIDENYTKAENYYSDLANQSRNQKLTTASRLKLVRLYNLTEKYQKEIEQLELLSDPSIPQYNDLLLKTADIYGHELKKFDTALTLYNFLLDRTDPQDTIMIPTLKFSIALTRMEQKKYSEARKLIAEIKDHYPYFYAANPTHQQIYARAYELDNKWSRAESEYNLLIERYRGSKEAMMIQLYIYDHFIEQGRKEEAERWFEDAEKYYKEIALSFQGTQAESMAMLYNADLQSRKNNWQESADLLEQVYNKYPHTEMGTRALVKAANIYKNDLNMPQKADSLINEIKKSLANVSSQNQDLIGN